MKKQLLALAVGSMVVVPSVALADKGPTVYGKVNVSYENQDNGTNDEWKLESNSSRIGVKGALDLDVDQLKAVYQAEFQIAVDDGDNKGQTFSQRNIFGGFEHATLGRLIAGKFDSPFKKSQGEIDQFGDLRGDINTIVGGSERISNIIQYSTPKLANAVTVNVAMVPGEGNTDFADRRDGPADGFSSSVVFDNGMLYGSVGYDSEIKTNLFDLGNADTLVDAMHVAAKVNMDQFEVGALVQQSKSSDSAFDGGDFKDTTYIVSGAFKVDRWKLKAQYGVTDTDLTSDKVKLTAVGADYKMAKASKVFGYFAKVESDNTGAGALAIDDTTFGVGFEHKFSM
jgi:hypothetical protein